MIARVKLVYVAGEQKLTKRSESNGILRSAQKTLSSRFYAK